MAYQTTNSFSTEDEDGGSGSRVDWAQHGICLQAGNDWPFVPGPSVEALNIPGMPGGYPYVNYCGPEQLTLACVVEGATMTDMLDALDELADETPATELKRWYIDGITDRYWLGRRMSGIRGEPIARKALQFNLVIFLDDPRPRSASTGNPIGDGI